MAGDWPKIKARRTTTVSPWMAIIEREVEFAEDASPELYHAVGQADYIAIVALTPEGKIPIVRNGQVQGIFAQKYHDCRMCDFYQKVKEEEGEDFLITVDLIRMIEYQ